MRFSASRLKVWQECQLQAKFRYIDMLPRGLQNAAASFGTVIHHSLELFNNTGNRELAIETFKDNWLNPEKLGVEPQVWPRLTSYGGYRETGIQLINNYADVVRWDDRVVIATEHEFVVPFGRHELHGFVDLLDARKSGKGTPLLRITDLKSNSRRPNMAELGLDVQFTTYCFASHQPEFWQGIPDGDKLFEKYKNTPRRNIWFHLRDAKEIDAGSRDQDDFDRLYRLCDEIERAHEHEVFVPHIGEPCLYCPYTEPCGLRVPTQEELAEQSDAWL